MLQKAILEMRKEEAEYHIKRCIDSGLWVPNAADAEGDGDGDGDQVEKEEGAVGGATGGEKGEAEEEKYEEVD